MEMKEIQKFISQHVFCYAHTEGQGFVKKELCPCYGKSEKQCEAYHEMNEFHQMYKELKEQGYSRKEIIEKFEDSLIGKNSHWFQYNVVK
jgi:hypothetical protein